MITNDNKKLAQWAMEFALKNGCQSSRVTLYNGSSSSFEIRDMKIDRLQQASENSLVIHLFVDGRYGSFSTNRLDKKELEKFIRNGIDSTRYLAEDKARTLPDASLYYKGDGADLQLIDPKFDSIQPDEKVSLAMKTCEEMMGKDDRIISANSSYSDEKDFKYMVASNGFEGEACGSSFSLVASVSIRGEGDARPESYWYDSGKYRMIVDNMNSGRLLSTVNDALYGSSIQQKNSFLLDKLDQKVLGDKLTLIDEPHLIKASGARYFDGEGVATKRMPVFENGVLKTYYIDTYSANKMEVKPTIASPSILTMQMGDKNTDSLIASVDKGILVTGFNGGNCNSTTGDFSYGVEGFLIEKGKLTQPISEMNATGNMIALWTNLTEVGNDPRLFSSWRIPSLLFDGVDFSGL
ncbi:TldD/PmbA family protein [Parabacteroides goldsteinii]|uniref:TldD/PmbA family protein n=1 Tax=Parabacteroides goldsteinii TaxID=328812 RepID=UPI00261707C4|nr:metallopeptidase TldD-related protein [Parabacteroides goldsteinii]